MKKMFGLLAAILLVSILSFASAEDKLITFRGIEWYTAKEDVEQKLYADGASSAGWLGSPEEIYRLVATDYSNVTMGSDRVDGGGVRAWYRDISVAGFTPSDTYACYLYPIQNGKIIYDDDQAEFYFGWYTFDAGDFADHEGIFDDLSEKLTKLYGTGKKESAKYHTTITWSDKEKNKIRLLINDKKNYVTLGYIAGDADSRLDEMEKALVREAKEKEKQERENNADNSDGL